jgi:branched-chain amino acid transport system substrate-binding protein
MKHRAISVLWKTALTLACCLHVGLAQAQANSFKIGVIGPFTGPSADFGNPMLNGIKLAVDEINAVGGYLGRPLELVIKDDKANPDEGLKQSQALIAEKVNVVVGFCNTGVAAKALDTFQSAQVPLIIPCSTGSPLTAKFPAPQSYIFRTSAKDAIQAPFVVEDIVKRGWSKVAIFADKSGYGEAGLQDVLKALEAKKIKPVYVARFDVGVKNLDEEMKAAKASGAEVLFSYTVGPENAVIAKAKQKRPPKARSWRRRSSLSQATSAAPLSFLPMPANTRPSASPCPWRQRKATMRCIF